jgi:predicted nucleic acid-binding protein
VIGTLSPSVEILCDTGPIVALLNRSDPAHAKCLSIIAQIPPKPLVTTWPNLTESMHFIGKHGGPMVQDKLWGLIADGFLRIHLPEPTEWPRMRNLMQRYADQPMDLADASLVSAAEVLKTTIIFTLDSHFHVYRIHDTVPFDVVSSDSLD